MFDEKDLADYRDTLPRAEVKARILSDLQNGIKTKKTEKIFLSHVLPIAACLALILTAVFLLGGAKNSLALSSCEQEQVSPMMMARMIAPVELRAKAQLPFPTSLTVKSGKVTVTDAETGELLGEGTQIRVHGNVLICWQLEEAPEESGELTLSCLGFTASYQADGAGKELIRTK